VASEGYAGVKHNKSEARYAESINHKKCLAQNLYIVVELHHSEGTTATSGAVINRFPAGGSWLSTNAFVTKRNNLYNGPQAQNYRHRHEVLTDLPFDVCKVPHQKIGNCTPEYFSWYSHGLACQRLLASPAVRFFLLTMPSEPVSRWQPLSGRRLSRSSLSL